MAVNSAKSFENSCLKEQLQSQVKLIAQLKDQLAAATKAMEKQVSSAEAETRAEDADSSDNTCVLDAAR